MAGLFYVEPDYSVGQDMLKTIETIAATATNPLKPLHFELDNAEQRAAEIQEKVRLEKKKKDNNDHRSRLLKPLKKTRRRRAADGDKPLQGAAAQRLSELLTTMSIGGGGSSDMDRSYDGESPRSAMTPKARGSRHSTSDQRVQGQPLHLTWSDRQSQRQRRKNGERPQTSQGMGAGRGQQRTGAWGSPKANSKTLGAAVDALVGRNSSPPNPRSSDSDAVAERFNRFHDVWRRRASRVKEMFEGRMNVYKLQQYRAEAEAEAEIERESKGKETNRRELRKQVMTAFNKQREQTRNGVVHGTTSAKRAMLAARPEVQVTMSTQRLMRRFVERQQKFARRMGRENQEKKSSDRKASKRQHDKTKKIFRRKYRDGRDWQKQIMHGFNAYDAKKEKERESVRRHIVKEKQVQAQRKKQAQQAKISEAKEDLDFFDQANGLIEPGSSDEEEIAIETSNAAAEKGWAAGSSGSVAAAAAGACLDEEQRRDSSQWPRKDS